MMRSMTMRDNRLMPMGPPLTSRTILLLGTSGACAPRVMR
jgi:hypothetical protein